MNKKALFWSSGLIGLLIIVWVIFGKSSNDENVRIFYKTKYAPFDVTVTTTGELQAENTRDILGPSGLQQIGIYNVKISDLVPEGTVVDSGDFVASLDKSELAKRLKDLENDILNKENKFLQAKLDTTLNMRQKRDELINLKYSLEEAKIKLEKSKFEPPATIRQAEINLDKTRRSYEQTTKNYELQKQKAIANVSDVLSNLNKSRQKKADLLAVMSKFEVKAPKGGMVIYVKEWSGKKRKVGSSISPWEPEVATLPDLSSMISRAFINEVDISKIKLNQRVEIGVDAFPNMHFTGSVIKVANVGEQKNNFDAKVFEVVIKLDSTNSVLKPGMTTSNKILVSHVDSVISVPIESINVSDSSSYVFVKKSLSLEKRKVKLGISNDNFIEILSGLSENENVLVNGDE